MAIFVDMFVLWWPIRSEKLLWGFRQFNQNWCWRWVSAVS